MERRERQTLRRALLLGDLLLLALAVAVAFGCHALLRGQLPMLRTPPSFGSYAALGWSLVPVWVALIVALGLDRSLETDADWTEAAARLLGLHLLALVAIALIAFLTQAVINRSIVVLFLGTSFLLMLLERRLLARWRRFQHESGHGRTRLLVAAIPGPDLEAFLARAAEDPFPPQLVGRLGPAADTAPLRWLGEVSGLESVLAAEAVDELVFFAPYERPESVAPLLAALEQFGVTARFAVPRPPGLDVAPSLSELHGTPFVTYRVAPKEPAALAFKHAFDFLAAAFLLIVLSPLFALLALAILLSSGRPVLFGQERAGLHGRRLRVLKFRTMVRDAETQREELLARNETGGPAFKMTQDPRVTPLGRLLRKWSLDELPQLGNVLAGSMSLVGPRPLPLREQAALRGWHRRRLSMKPGITGLWQVSGRNDVGFEEWMRLDLRYVDEWSLLLDVEILLRTLPAVLSARGAR
ncbi:MAG: exopolysaccharide biosynthesis polyprenyl glycosylphosphotransferase [Vicinamibacteria bacterium]